MPNRWQVTKAGGQGVVETVESSEMSLSTCGALDFTNDDGNSIRIIAPGAWVDVAYVGTDDE